MTVRNRQPGTVATHGDLAPKPFARGPRKAEEASSPSGWPGNTVSALGYVLRCLTTGLASNMLVRRLHDTPSAGMANNDGTTIY